MSLLHLRDLSAERLAALSRDTTVLFLGVGPVEDHGPHLPVGLDLAATDQMIALTAARLERELPGWNALVLPSLPLGIEANTRVFALTVRGYVLRDFLVDFCGSMAREGFRHFVCFTGHTGPRQLVAIEEAGRLLRRRFTGGWLRRSVLGRPVVSLVSANSALINRDQAFRSPLWPDAIEHGGLNDTSLALAIGAPVDARYLAMPESRRVDSYWERAWNRLTRKTRGYWTSASEPTAKATAESGQLSLNAQVDTIFPKLRAVWEGSDPSQVFRSGYGIFPSNGSYFRAWIYVLLLAAMISVWVYLNIRAML